MSRRKIEKQITRDNFIILTNGKQTECKYFKQLKSKHSIYDVTIKFENANPLALVKQAINYINHSNQVWCVFDIDDFHEQNKIIPTFNLAKQYGIKIAYSNISFETWLISHFEQCEKKMDNEKCIELLNQCLKEFNITYDKSNETIFKKLIPKYKSAVENSKIVYQKLIKKHHEKFGNNNDNYKIWEWNSSNTVYKLVEALKLKD